MPRNAEHAAYADMSRELNSDVIALNILGQAVVVLNSATVTTELMEKKSSIYSGRAQIPVVSDEDMMDWGKSISFLEMGERWRHGRRMLHEALHKGVMHQYHPNQEKHIQILLSRLLDSPPTLEKFRDELNFAIGSGLIYATYGYTPKSPQDEWLKAAQDAIEHIVYAAQPAAFLVNFIPALKYLPDWLPGMSWKRVINGWRAHKDYIASAPYNWTKEQMAIGDAVPSILQKILSALPESTPNPEDEPYIEMLAATMFSAGTDTTVASGMYFILAMVRHPEVSIKIQVELDRVLGNAERLPRVEDRERMPYVRSTVLEVLRWQPVSPLALPHSTLDDDQYKGYHIPKGSIVMGNTWAITRDASIYPDPERFNPDRFLDPQVPPAPSFGYGRRVCPGSQFAESNLFLLISSLMYVFDIRRAVDETGKEIIPEVNISPEPTLVSRPLPFKFRMKPRSEAHKSLVINNVQGL